MEGRRLGRQHRAHDPRVPAITQVRRAMPLPPIPAALNWLESMPAGLGMMLNDKLGDCTCAAFFHGLQVWTFHAEDRMQTEPDNCVLALYEGACGYVPGNADTDNGGIEQNVLRYIMTQGAPLADGTVSKISAFIELDPRQTDDIKRGIAECGFVYLGINIPESWCSMPVGMDWTDASGPIAGGHAIIVAGYDADWLYVVSWGSIWRLSWQAFAAVCDEAYVLFSPEWVNAKGMTPFGITLDVAEATMRAAA